MTVAPAFLAAARKRAAKVEIPQWIDDRRLTVPMTAIVWTLVVLMIVPEGLDYSAISSEAMGGSPITKMLWLAMLGIGTALVVWRAPLAWLLIGRLNLFFTLFVVLATASILWSIDPTTTLRRLIRLYTITLVAAMSVLVSWHERRYQELVRPIITIMLAGSIVFGLLFPTLAIHSGTQAEIIGAWRGLTLHKNSLGALSSMGAILWFQAWLAREVPWYRAIVGVGIAMTTLLLSRSSTSLVTTLFVFCMLFMLLRSPRNLRRWMPLAITVFVSVLLLYALAVLRLVPGLDIILQPVVMLTGKDLTFTGRSEIWALVNEHIAKTPLLGTGYGAFWTGPVPGSPSYIFLTKLYFYPASSHNGYLEVVNDLGTVGMVCLGGYLFRHVAQSLQLFRYDRPQAALFLALFFQQAISNLSESRWLSVLNFDFVIVTLGSFALARTLLEQRLRHYFGNPSIRSPGRIPPDSSA